MIEMSKIIGFLKLDSLNLEFKMCCVFAQNKLGTSFQVTLLRDAHSHYNSAHSLRSNSSNIVHLKFIEYKIKIA